MRLAFAAAAVVLTAMHAPAQADGRLEALGIRVAYQDHLPARPPKPEFDRPRDALPDGNPGFGENDIAQAWLIAPTARYDHGVLGDAIEAGGLRVILRDGQAMEFLLDENSVFEDLSPRLADLDGDGRDEVVVVRSHLNAGAALAVFGVRHERLELLAETSPIGRRNRWLNPVGAGDFDGDGGLEIAYVETPHIGGTLRIVALQDGRLVEMAAERGFSNHAIGSRALRLSAILDFDGDGSDDILVPANGRETLRLASFAGGKFRELATFDAQGAVQDDFLVADWDGDGRADVAFQIYPGLVTLLKR